MNKKEKIIRADLTEELNEVESALADSYNNLQIVTEEGLIDYYTYQIKANQAKLDYLIKLAKARGIKVDMINDKKYSFLDNEEAG